MVFGRRLAAGDVVWIKCGVGQAANRACCAIHRNCIRSAGHELRCGHCAGEGRRVGHADFDFAIGDGGFKVAGRGVGIAARYNRKAAAQRLCAAAAVTGEGDRFDHFAIEVAQGVTHIVGYRIACAIGFGDGVAWSSHRSIGINRCATTQSVYDGFQLADVHRIGVGCSRTQSADLVGRAVGHNTAHGGFVRSDGCKGNVIRRGDGDVFATARDFDVFAIQQLHCVARRDFVRRVSIGLKIPAFVGDGIDRLDRIMNSRLSRSSHITHRQCAVCTYRCIPPKNRSSTAGDITQYVIGHVQFTAINRI